jgi:hypothetical protein
MPVVGSDLRELASLSSVLRSWENRPGVRLVELGLDTLGLAVAGPARRRAVELA